MTITGRYSIKLESFAKVHLDVLDEVLT